LHFALVTPLLDAGKERDHRFGAKMKRDLDSILATYSARQRDPTREKHPWWDCAAFPPTCEEVETLARTLPDDFRVNSNDGKNYLGNRDWHVKQIAALYRWWRDDHPIEVKNRDVMNGGHRLIAAHCKGFKEIDVVEI
jgi:hypothetical protein